MNYKLFKKINNKTILTKCIHFEIPKYRAVDIDVFVSLEN